MTRLDTAVPAPAGPRSRSGHYWLRRFAVPALLAGLLVAVPATAEAQSCIVDSTRNYTDFDGDKKPDLAIADPDATVNGKDRAGRIHIAYGKGTFQTFNQDPLPDQGADAGDQFGHALATTDWNKDGCTDLVVGTPGEDLANNEDADAGEVELILGSPTGLVPATALVWRQGNYSGVASEEGDRFGFSLAAGTTTVGTPFVVMGAPGEAIGELAGAGMVLYSTPSFTIGLGQNQDQVPGAVEAGDGFGYSVAASPSGFAIGTPAEDIGTATGTANYAGDFALFPHPTTAAVQTAIVGINQDIAGVSGAVEANDFMGAELAMVDYIPPGATTVSTLVVAGAPGENASDGWVMEFDMKSGTWVQRRTYSQGTAIEAGGSEHGDDWGASIAAINRDPKNPVMWEDLLIASGAPGEDKTDPALPNRGIVQVLSGVGAAADHDTDADAALTTAGLEWEAGQRIGSSILATPANLWVADPWSTTPTVYGIPWDNIIATGTTAATDFTPADFGVTDAVSFGATLA